MLDRLPTDNPTGTLKRLIRRLRPPYKWPVAQHFIIALSFGWVAPTIAQSPLPDEPSTPASASQAKAAAVASLPDIDRAATTDEPGLGDPTQRIPYLIKQLDSINYLARESAAVELARVGGSAIGPLAYQSLQGSPEQCWRIKKTLEKICTDGDEEVFFRALGILQLRFDGGNIEMSQKMVELQNKWRLKRKQEVVAMLRSKGAEILDPWENVDANDLPGARLGGLDIFGNGRNIILNGGNVQVLPDNLPPGKAKVAKKSKPDRRTNEELKTEFAKILDLDLDETRDLVLRIAERSSGPQDVGDPFSNPVVLNQAIFARAGFPRTSRGVELKLTEAWTGTTADFAKLNSLAGLSVINLEQIAISTEDIQAFASLPGLNRIRFDRVEVEEDALKGLVHSTSLRELEFVDRDVTPSLINGIAAVNSMQKLTFDQCRFEDKALESLKSLNGLRFVEIRKTEINLDMFDAIADIKRLTDLSLTACKFQTRDFEKFKFRRPRMQVAFSAQAFLGVRGPVEAIIPNGIDDTDSSGCLISEVISGSGADKGGMQVGDVIETVNKQPISKFEDLRLHIAQHVPGDKLDVVVSRDGESIDLVIELGDVNAAPPN